LFSIFNAADYCILYILVKLPDDDLKSDGNMLVINNMMKHILFICICRFYYIRHPVTTAWYVLRLWMEEWPLIWRAGVNKLKKQQTTDK